MRLCGLLALCACGLESCKIYFDSEPKKIAEKAKGDKILVKTLGDEKFQLSRACVSCGLG